MRNDDNLSSQRFMTELNSPETLYLYTAMFKLRVRNIDLIYDFWLLFSLSLHFTDFEAKICSTLV